jgi:hypothetical protein
MFCLGEKTELKLKRLQNFNSIKCSYCQLCIVVVSALILRQAQDERK